MARVNCPAVTVPGKFPTAGVLVTLTPADTDDLNSFSLTGDELLVILNTDASDHTYTINSVADPIEHRTGDLTGKTIAAGAMHVPGPFDVAAWAQSTGVLNLEADDATVVFGVIKLH